jgi:hypothetical protein
LGEANKIYHKFTQTCQLWAKRALTEFFLLHLMPKLKTLDAFDKIQDNSGKKAIASFNRNKKTT